MVLVAFLAYQEVGFGMNFSRDADEIYALHNAPPIPGAHNFSYPVDCH